MSGDLKQGMTALEAGILNYQQWGGDKVELFAATDFGDAQVEMYLQESPVDQHSQASSGIRGALPRATTGNELPASTGRFKQAVSSRLARIM